jgi:hypothetical protein
LSEALAISIIGSLRPEGIVMSRGPRGIEVERFETEDQAGNGFTVIGRAVPTSSTGLDGVERSGYAGTNYALLEGERFKRLIKLDSETFQIAGSDQIVRKIS